MNFAVAVLGSSMFLVCGQPPPQSPWSERAAAAAAAAETDPSVARLHAALEAAWRADDWLTGQRIARLALRAEPDDRSLRPPVVRALWRAGDIRDAERLSDDIQPDTADRDALVTLARLELARGRTEAARRAAARLERLGPQSAEQAYALMSAKMLLHDPEGLAALARRAAALCDPERGYPDSILQESLIGFPELLAQIDDKPLNVIAAHGAAEMPPMVGFGLPNCSVYINGKGPYRLILDTGGSVALSLATPVARELGLRTLAESSVRGVSGPQPAALTVVDRLTIGPIEVERVLTHSFSLPGVIDGLVDGVLGTGVFAEARFTLDLQNGRFVVAPSSDEPAAGAPLDLRIVADAKLVGLIEIDGRPVTALIDSGADAIALSPSFAREAHPDQAFTGMDLPAVTGVGEDQAGQILIVPPVTARIAGREIEQFGGLALSVLDETLSPIIGLQFDLLAGMPLLREMRALTVDGPRRRAWVEWLPAD